MRSLRRSLQRWRTNSTRFVRFGSHLRCSRLRLTAGQFEQASSFRPGSYYLPTEEGRTKHCRTAIEEAIDHLLQLDFPDPAERAKVHGAEWWLWRRLQNSNHTFHFDKVHCVSPLSLDTHADCRTSA